MADGSVARGWAGGEQESGDETEEGGEGKGGGEKRRPPSQSPLELQRCLGDMLNNPDWQPAREILPEIGEHTTPPWLRNPEALPSGCKIQRHLVWKVWQFSIPSGEGTKSKVFGWDRPKGKDGAATAEGAYALGMDWIRSETTSFNQGGTASASGIVR